MALSAAQKKEMDDYLASREAEIRSQITQELAGPQPMLPTVQEYALADVLRILVQHTRIPTEAMQLAMLAAIDREFEAAEETDEDTTVKEPATA